MLKKILIVGGGFGGIRTALNLAKQKLPDVQITLISDRAHFEFHPALFRVVTGHAPEEVSISLADIFAGKNVTLVQDTITDVVPGEKMLTGASGAQYSYEYLVLGLGSETDYFNIPGLAELSFGFTTIDQALKLRHHLHDVFRRCHEEGTSEAKVCDAHIVIVGGGATGTELAGELAVYLRQLAKQYDFEPSLVTLDLIEAAPRLLGVVPERMSRRIAERLHKLGVNIFLNRSVIREEVETVFMKDMEMKTKTLIWAAGVKPNSLYCRIPGVSLTPKHRVEVDEFLQAKNLTGVFVIGDGASTPHTGMAQTALSDGAQVADIIAKKILGKTPLQYDDKSVVYAVPVGPHWAAVALGGMTFYGLPGWIMRQLADLRFFLSILPPTKALTVMYKSYPMK